MKEELNALLVKIEQLAREKDEFEIIKAIQDIIELLGEDYEIYKLNN